MQTEEQTTGNRRETRYKKERRSKGTGTACK